MTSDLPSAEARAEFLDWLRYILKNPDGNIHAWADHLIGAQDWHSSRVVEISGRQTKTGNPEIFTFKGE